jgi:outer membrane immunogenic protein
MRKATIVAALAAVVGFSGAALADGMYSKPAASYKDAPIVVSSPTWAGLYIGGTAGFGVGNTSGQLDVFGNKESYPHNDNLNQVSSTLQTNGSESHGGGNIGDFLNSLFSSDYDVQGAVYGIHIGYNWQRGPMVFGVEASINGTDIEGSSACGALNFSDCNRELDYYGTVAGRIGYAVDRVMFYAMGGVAYGEVKTDVDFLGGIVSLSGDETHTGWVAGLGIEYAMTDRFIVRIEYSHIDLGDENTDLNVKFGGESVGKIDDKVDLEFDVIKVGASYKLGDRHQPLESMK